MSHNVETMAYAGEVPWHGLGQEVSNDLTTVQMMKASGTDWLVEKFPLSGSIKNQNGGRFIVNPGKAALVRMKNGVPMDVVDNEVLPLDTVGDDWNPIQNEEAFEFFREYIEAGGMEMHTAGSLQAGKYVWVLAKTKESFKVFKGDEIDQYLLFTNPHKYGASADVRHTPIRVVCNNTLSMALNEKGKQDRAVKISHRTKFNADEVKKTLGIAKGQMEAYKEMALFLGEKRYAKEELLKFYDEIFPTSAKSEEKKNEPSRNAKKAFELTEEQPGANYAPGTWWNAFNSVTFMQDHVLGRTDDGRLESAWYGAGRNAKNNALKLAVDYAKAA